METKKEIRAYVRKLREKQDPILWKRDTDAIAKVILSHEWFLEAPAIYCYVSFRGEVGTDEIIKGAWTLGKEVYVPRMEGDEMEFYLLNSFEELEEGSFGVPEPALQSGQTVVKERSGHKNTSDCLMLMPGVAFDKNRNRVGFGGGYYDRYLNRHPGIRTVGLAFEFQIVDDIPVEETDIRPGILVTERRIL